jgi:hypothetical protein
VTTDHAPDERSVPLTVDPGVVVVGDQAEAETRVFRANGIPDEIEGRVLLARKRVADLHGSCVPDDP